MELPGQKTKSKGPGGHATSLPLTELLDPVEPSIGRTLGPQKIKANYTMIPKILPLIPLEIY